MNPIPHSDFNYHTLPVTPFKMKCSLIKKPQLKINFQRESDTLICK